MNHKVNHPRALYLLNFVSMWECFSYYGMRVLMVLFMIHEMSLSDHAAFGLYALYTTLIEFGGLVGGIAADRFLGLKRSIVLGGWTIALGHLCLSLPGSETFFFLGLGLIVAGTSLFRSNAAALLGEFYQRDDPRREAGFTLYYTGINFGGFLASLVCGFVGEVYGWHAGFSLAALGMLSGNIALIFGWKMLAGKGENNASTSNIWGLMGLGMIAPVFASAIYFHEAVAPFIPIIAAGGIGFILWKTRSCTPVEKKGLNRLALYVFFLIIFFACEEQLGSTLILFSERHVDRNLVGFGLIPAASLIMFNPMTILCAGPLLSRVMQKIPLHGIFKIGLSFLFLGIAFCLLYAGCTINSEGVVPLSYAICSIVLIALGEIFIGPTVYAYASEAAPRNLQGLTMGIVTMGFALANYLSGWLSRLMVVVEETSSLGIYSWGFGVIGSSIVILSLAVFFLNNRINGSYYDSNQVCD